jgi:anti-sigma B factor antagonist
MTPAEHMTVTAERNGQELVVRVLGEMDLGTSRLVEIAARPQPGCTRVLLDMSALSFLDSAGLNTLLRARRQAARNGVRLVLCALRPNVRKLLSLVGADLSFEITDHLPPAPDRSVGKKGQRPVTGTDSVIRGYAAALDAATWDHDTAAVWADALSWAATMLEGGEHAKSARSRVASQFGVELSPPAEADTPRRSEERALSAART